MKKDKLLVANKKFNSRLIVGTGKYENITGTGFSSRQNLVTKVPGFSTSMNQMSGEYKY